ncbi:hypothetical protein M427DRAFT_26854 [Gonapodya prolifera JEL478]|uniref:Uncharacterized protein n=1 Tax=Gonapodya prolifera (strain JEL478) TaxID=1344416 RepID=A0A139AZS3_GONPJ|nr:hypothetical protein M427DRAFT_26854 [Gonapodya prolifera JEL478]|eukprot:KXS22242.1 hypothetical protein M427DRAFT_26854 [Gonapodya prolifera JEL478]
MEVGPRTMRNANELRIARVAAVAVALACVATVAVADVQDDAIRKRENFAGTTVTTLASHQPPQIPTPTQVLTQTLLFLALPSQGPSHYLPAPMPAGVIVGSVASSSVPASMATGTVWAVPSHYQPIPMPNDAVASAAPSYQPAPMSSAVVWAVPNYPGTSQLSAAIAVGLVGAGVVLGLALSLVAFTFYKRRERRIKEEGDAQPDASPDGASPQVVVVVENGSGSLPPPYENSNTTPMVVPPRIESKLAGDKE